MAVLEQTGIDITDMLPVTLTKPGLTEEEYFALCARFDDAMVEYTADGTIIIMPGTDPKSGRRDAQVVRQLGNWAEQDGRGSVTGPNASFLFPHGARLEPDAAWVDNARWEAAQEVGRRVPVFAPEFVVEVHSPEQRARPQHEKMQEYIANGVLLGWLIDPLDRTVTIYRTGQPPEILLNPATVAGEGPVAGFVLDLKLVFSD